MRHSTIDGQSNTSVVDNVSNVGGNGYTVLENNNIKAYGIDPISKVSEQQGEGTVERNKCPVVIYSPALTITTEDPSETIPKPKTYVTINSYCELFFEESGSVSEDESTSTIDYTNSIDPTQFLRMYSMKTEIIPPSSSTHSSIRGRLSMLIKGFSKETNKATGVIFDDANNTNNNLSRFTREKVVYQIVLGDSCPLINGLNVDAYTKIDFEDTSETVATRIYTVTHSNLVLRSIDTRMCNVTAPVGTYSTININGTTADIYKVLYATAKPSN